MLILGNGEKKHLPANQYLGADFAAKANKDGWVETTLYYAEGAAAVLTSPEEVMNHSNKGDWLHLEGEFRSANSKEE